MHTTTIVPHLKQCEFNMFAANPTFARIGSRISFDMFKSLRRASVFYFAKSKTLNPWNPKTLNPKLKPLILKT